MQEKYIIQKNLGETPLETLTRLRKSLNISEEIPMTYAGRLDPAAEGLLIILTGEECKKKDEYTVLQKTYVAEIVFGVGTDSYDLLGIPLGLSVIPDLIRNPGSEAGMMQEKIEAYFKNHLGKQMQKYPHFSSKNIDTGTLPPPHEVELISCKNIKIGERTREEILERVERLTQIVTGDFRQKEIRTAWQNLKGFATLPSVSLELSVSSGFYIRQLAEDLGKAIGGNACLYSLARTKIGEYEKTDF